MINQKAYINGVFIKSKSSISIVSPVDQKICGNVPALSLIQIDDACNAAAAAQQEWQFLTRDKRISYIEVFLQKLNQQSSLLVDLMVKEIGKSIDDCFSEINRTKLFIEDTIHEYYNMFLKFISSPNLRNDKKSVSITLEPIGPVAVISPFNFPINLSLSKIIPALITGNTVVFKPSTNGSIVGTELAKIFHNSGFPPGVINIVTGHGKDIGDRLWKNKNIKQIAYTGSTSIGLRILNESKVQTKMLEMGGNAAAIVFNDADVVATARDLIKGAFSFSGQRCTAIKRVYVQSGIKNNLIMELKRQVIAIAVGSPLDNALVVPVINHKSSEYLEYLISNTIESGATLLCGGLVEANLVYPTIFMNVKNKSKIVQEEQFGPIMPIVNFNTQSQVINYVNNSRFGLQVSIFTSDISKATKMGTKINVGSININGIPSRSPDVLPFLGTKDSGFGVQGVKYIIKSFTRPKPYIINKIY